MFNSEDVSHVIIWFEASCLLKWHADGQQVDQLTS